MTGLSIHISCVIRNLLRFPICYFTKDRCTDRKTNGNKSSHFLCIKSIDQILLFEAFRWKTLNIIFNDSTHLLKNYMKLQKKRTTGGKLRFYQDSSHITAASLLCDKGTLRMVR